MKDLKEILKDFSGNRTLMVVYPHPDDETMAAGGLLLAAKKFGWTTIAILLTKGAAGQVHIHPKGRSLKELRTQELQKAAKILGVDKLILGDFDDGRLREQKGLWIKWLEEQIKTYDPSIVVTYDHSGFSGHPDHIVLSVESKKILKDKLVLWTTMSKQFASRIINPLTLDHATSPDYVLDLKNDWWKKWRAARAHASQSLGKDMPAPLSILLAWQHYEWYHKVDFNRNYSHKFVEFKI